MGRWEGKDEGVGESGRGPSSLHTVKNSPGSTLDAPFTVAIQ
jgi:hypothetical protein